MEIPASGKRHVMSTPESLGALREEFRWTQQGALSLVTLLLVVFLFVVVGLMMVVYPILFMIFDPDHISFESGGRWTGAPCLLMAPVCGILMILGGIVAPRNHFRNSSNRIAVHDGGLVYRHCGTVEWTPWDQVVSIEVRGAENRLPSHAITEDADLPNSIFTCCIYDKTGKNIHLDCLGEYEGIVHLGERLRCVAKERNIPWKKLGLLD